MLTGVVAIDAALLIVAADDGVMPQTTEHLQILDLLGVNRGAIVITKTDLVPPARIAEVTAQVRGVLAGTSLADVELFPVCARTREGLPALREWLAAQAAVETQHA